MFLIATYIHSYVVMYVLNLNEFEKIIMYCIAHQFLKYVQVSTLIGLYIRMCWCSHCWICHNGLWFNCYCIRFSYWQNLSCIFTKICGCHSDQLDDFRIADISACVGERTKLCIYICVYFSLGNC